MFKCMQDDTVEWWQIWLVTEERECLGLYAILDPTKNLKFEVSGLRSLIVAVILKSMFNTLVCYLLVLAWVISSAMSSLFLLNHTLPHFLEHIDIVMWHRLKTSSCNKFSIVYLFVSAWVISSAMHSIFFPKSPYASCFTTHWYYYVT